jgi:putative ubiquitin-RnfH superfamily antitoxin RatB of RatAB toxin-antitoxin module
MDRAEPGPRLRICVVYSPAAGSVDEIELELGAGATVADALRASGLAARHPELDLATAAIGVWGALCTPDRPLRDRDRVEVYRPLRVDPKEARRQRQRAQGKVGR